MADIDNEKLLARIERIKSNYARRNAASEKIINAIIEHQLSADEVRRMFDKIYQYILNNTYLTEDLNKKNPYPIEKW